MMLGLPLPIDRHSARIYRSRGSATNVKLEVPRGKTKCTYPRGTTYDPPGSWPLICWTPFPANSNTMPGGRAKCSYALVEPVCSYGNKPRQSEVDIPSSFTFRV